MGKNSKLEGLSEETQDLFGRVPDDFNTKLTIMAAVVLLALVSACIFIKSPDIVISEVRIAGKIPPQVLRSKTSGKISLLVDNLPKHCRAGDYIACIDNPANAEDIRTLKQTLSSEISFDNNSFDLPDCRTLSLGELTSSFFSLERALLNYKNLTSLDNQYEFEMVSLQNQIAKDSITLQYYEQLLDKNELLLSMKSKEYAVDSVLLSRKALLETEKNHSLAEYIRIQKEVLSDINTLSITRQDIINCRSKLKELIWQYDQDKKKAYYDMLNSYNILMSEIKQWENMYVFSVDVDGVVEYANLIADNTFITAGEPVFTLIVEDNEYYGTALLPHDGAGNVSIGQDVNIKVSAYPFEEHGLLKGRVTGVSKNYIADGGYLVYIQLPSGLKSTNGELFSFAEAMTGRAEIITEEKRLIEKLLRHVYMILSNSPSDE